MLNRNVIIINLALNERYISMYFLNSKNKKNFF